MFSMSTLRERQKGLLWALLFFFIASMTVGGLVGGANIIDVIKSAFGGVDTRLYVGRIGAENIPISYYLNERQNQLNRFRQQGRSIDSRAIQNAGDFAWNNIVERTIKDIKIDEFNLGVQDDEIYDFLLLSPPIAFQNNLMELGIFKDENNTFKIEEYQESVRRGLLPDTTKQILFAWENYLETYLADRKLQNLFGNSISISDNDVKNEFINNNVNCTLDILNINYSSIEDSLITIDQDDILSKYNDEKEEKYLIEESISVEYKLFENIISIGIDSTDIIDLQDSLLQLSIDFASDADIISFHEALVEYDLEVTDTIQVTESFTNNSGIPFRMGVLRQAVRFSFDNNAGSTSEAFTTDNGIAVFHIIKQNPSIYKELSEVESSIKRSLTSDYKKEYALNMINNIDINGNWESISNDNSLFEYHQGITGTIGGNFEVIGRNSEVTGLLNHMNTNDVSYIIESSGNTFVFKLINKDELDEIALDESFDSLKVQLLNREKSQAFNSWLNNEKKNLKIKDLRSKIF